MIRISLLLIGLTSFFYSYASQDVKADSLKYLLGQSSGHEKFELLFELGKHYDKVDSLDLIEKYFLEAIQYGLADRKIQGVQLVMRYLGLYYIETWEPELAKTWMRKAMALARSSSDEYTLMFCKVDLGILYIRSMDYDSATIVLNEALFLATKQDNDIAEVSILTSLSQIKDQSGDFLEAAKLLFEIIRKCKENSFQPELAIMHNNLGNLYRMIDPDISRFYFQEAQSIADSLKDNDLLSMIYLNLSYTLIQLKMHKEAEEILFQAAELSKKVGDSVRLAQVYNSLSSIEVNLYQCSKGKLYSDSALAIVNKKFLEYGGYQIQFVEALIDDCNGNTDLAIQKLIDIAGQFSEVGMISFEQEAYFVLYELYLKKSNFQKAVEFLEKSDSLMQEFASDSIKSKAIDLHYQQMIQAEKEHFKFNETEWNEKLGFNRFLLLAVSFLLLFFIVLSFVYRRRIGIITNKEEKYAEDLNEIKHIIQEIHPADLRTDAHSVCIQTKLKESYPNLSDLDLQICDLITQKFSTKEIAVKLNRSVGTIDNHRSIIRKKLNLDDSITLADHLQSLNEEVKT